MAAFGFFGRVGVLSGSRVAVVLMQILALPLISRYLTTAEFGTIALAMSVVIFCQTLSDAGLGRSLIRQPEYDHDEWSGVFWFLLAIGLGLALLIILSAGLLERAFRAPGLSAFSCAFSVLPLLLALSAVPTAKLEKQGRFAAIAVIRLLSALAGLFAVVTLAVQGAGAWALAAQLIIVASIDFLAIWAVAGFWPSFVCRKVDLRRHFTFARDNIGVSLLFAAQRQIPVMLIGSVLGAAALGLYSMSQRLLRLPLLGFGGPFSQVVYVRMARIQEQRAKVGELYVETVRILSLVVVPPMLLLAVIGEQAFGVIFSEAWSASGRIFALAAPGIALEVGISAAGVAYQATGETGLRLRMATERAILRTGAICCAIPFGLEAAAMMITVYAVLYLPRFWILLQRAAPFNAQAALGGFVAPIVASVIVGAALRYYLPPEIGIGGLLLWFLGATVLAWALAAAAQVRALQQSVIVLNG